MCPFDMVRPGGTAACTHVVARRPRLHLCATAKADVLSVARSSLAARANRVAIEGTARSARRKF